MWHSDYRYFAELTSTAGKRLGDVRLEVDWFPALRCAEFQPMLLRARPAVDAAAVPRIDPLWSSEQTAPYLNGVRIHGHGDDSDAVELPVSYFADAVSAASLRLVESGALEAGEHFEYRIYALPDDAGDDRPASSIDVAPVPNPPQVHTLELAPLLADAERQVANPGATDGHGTDTGKPRVFVPHQVLIEATQMSRAADNVETGGFLLGWLCRDPGGELFVTVTVQIPARHTTGTEGSLRLSPETWADVNAAIRLRGRNEVALGWWHCHPFFCRQCPPARRALCPFSTPAFSVADRAVHREVFQQAWSIALLLSFLGERLPSYDVFGWRRGRIEAVDFYTLTEPVTLQGESL